MSEDNDKLKAIMDALKKSQDFASDGAESDDKQDAAKEELGAESNSEEDSNGSDLYREEETESAGEPMEAVIAAEDGLSVEEDEVSGLGGVEDSSENREDYDPLKDDADDATRASDSGDDDMAATEKGREDTAVVVVPENDEKENKEGSSDGRRRDSKSGEEQEVALQSREAVGSGGKEDDRVCNENIDRDLLQRQVQYVLDSDMLSLPEFQELSSREKVVAIVTLLNSNGDTSMPSKGSSTGVSEAIKRRRFPPPDMSQAMTPEERQRYTEYLRGENRITEIEHFPPKSRLFIGNLPLKNVTKEDLFRIFSPYGHIFQINIKNAFGFIQYDNAQSVKDAIECESGTMNFGKKLILEVSSSNSRPQFDHGDHGTNSSSTFVTSSKRPFDEQGEEEDMYSDNHYKKTKKRIPQCMILVKRTADRSYANEVFNIFRNGSGLETDMVFLKPRMELRKLINDAAYDGVWGVILVNKTRNVDIQTFYKGPQGETKFDEYVSVSCEDSIAIFNNLKTTRAGRTGSISPPVQQRAKLPPQQQQQPPPPPRQQQYYAGYAMPPQQPPYVAQPSIYGAINPASQPPPPQRQQQQYASMQPYGAFPAQQLPIAAPPTHATAPMDQSQLLAAIQHLPQNVLSSLLSMTQQQPNQQQQQQQLLGLIQQLQSGQQPQLQQPLPSNVGAPYAAFGSPPQNANMLAGSPPPMPPQQQIPQPQQHQPPQPPQPQPPQPQPQPPHQKQPSVPQVQPQQAGSNVQSLLDSLAQLQK
ncbi:AFL070Cp [Eremothecium gossypii ATCC 10895]|uniref:AFL070Cp n=1 Tax=Eremothecium gossypii (strain ATCC 10895 / CBS 109.51 / FGSC 9923 / NRRL Y-1056) TaxID=284811 RepID=Q754Y1_EREGS|nr:AFL070Cp [Eremothecium gossypii ATCC 10895]AAS53302.1 AFL070Cp [Eremothecium gossypii ATCC 10895]AEY97613.1 FAFL070Cp [Eremothecium gossypii FDAG1]